MNWVHHLRRGATKRAVLAALAAAGRLGPAGARSLGAALGRAAASTPGMRSRLAANLRAAGIDPTDDLVRAYFRRFGIWSGHTLGAYAVGLDRSLVCEWISLDPVTLPRLDAAVAVGRGVVLAAPHLFGHELAAGLIHRRHPVSAVVRESKDPAWVEVKARWYGQALGLNTVVRPRRGSGFGDVTALIRVLRSGSVLGITPDVITGRASGLVVDVFGKPVCLPPGMVLLAALAKAPLVTAYGEWYPDPTAPGGERVRVAFTEPLDLPSLAGDREAGIREGLRRWCEVFERILRHDPAAWLFWLDKGWTKVLTRPPAARGE